ncbi:MAG: IS110 family transposase [Marivirga sp.]|nr:IS110 family transposase [Marivirga sp.]
MNEVTKFFGIDVSMKTFDVSTADHKHFQFSNDPEGFRKLIRLLDSESQCVMEATGSYHQKLATWLSSQGSRVSVVNPLVIKRFAQMRLRLAKTDKADANIIRQYAEAEKPEIWSPPQEYITQSCEINGLIMLFIRQRTALKNKLHSVNHKEGKFSMILKTLQMQIKNLDQEISKLEAAMEKLIKEFQGEMFTSLCSIPGIGKKTAMFLIVLTDAFRSFENSKQLCAYLGLAPTIKMSGKSVRGKSRISKTGNSVMRNLLFMCSFTACERNKACREQYNRMVEKGKSKKVALIAVANKLLKQSIAIAKSGKIYNEQYQRLTPACIH